MVTLVPATGQPVQGRVVRLGPDDVAIRPSKSYGGPPPRDGGLRDVTVRFDALQSLRRPRDSARNGTLIGAGVGAGFAGALFIYAFAVDRNEAEEWAPVFLAFGGLTTGIGAVAGWAVDAARSKPDIRFDASPQKHTQLRVHPIVPRGRGIGLAVSVSR